MSALDHNNAENPENSFFARQMTPNVEISTPAFSNMTTAQSSAVAADEPHRDGCDHHDEQRQHLDDGSISASRPIPEEGLLQDPQRPLQTPFSSGTASPSSSTMLSCNSSGVHLHVPPLADPHLHHSNYVPGAGLPGYEPAYFTGNPAQTSDQGEYVSPIIIRRRESPHPTALPAQIPQQQNSPTTGQFPSFGQGEHALHASTMRLPQPRRSSNSSLLLAAQSHLRGYGNHSQAVPIVDPNRQACEGADSGFTSESHNNQGSRFLTPSLHTQMPQQQHPSVQSGPGPMPQPAYQHDHDGIDPGADIEHHIHQGAQLRTSSFPPRLPQQQQPSMRPSQSSVQPVPGSTPQAPYTWQATVPQSGMPLGPVLQPTQRLSDHSEPGALRLQLITGDWITVSATPAALASPVPAKCWPIGQDGIPQAIHLSHEGNAQHLHDNTTPDAPSTTTGSGVDPCADDWEDLEGQVSDETDDIHTLSLSQRDQVHAYNKQLVRQQSLGDSVDFSRQNVVETMCNLWPLSIILETATRRNRISTIHELLHYYGKHHPSYISNLNQSLKRKEGPELQLAIRTTVNSMYLVRNEYPIEVIQLTMLLHVTDRIRDSRFSAKLKMLSHLSNEAMWTSPEDLEDLWADVERLHESPMACQLHAQAQGQGIWSSPGVLTFSPHHPLFSETWASFYKSCLHVLCYQPTESIKRHFERALAAFEDKSWRQGPYQSVREFNADFNSQLSSLRQAANLDGLNVLEVVPKDVVLVSTYKDRLLKTKRDACLRSLKQKTYIVDHPHLDLDYAGNTLNNLTLTDFMLLASVAWRQEDGDNESDFRKARRQTQDYGSKYGKFRSSSPTHPSRYSSGDPRRQADFKPRSSNPRGVRTASATAESSRVTIPDIASLQKASKGEINSTESYKVSKHGDVVLAPVYQHGCTKCSNCQNLHWHDQPCDKAKDTNSALPNSQRHSQATRSMIEKMNSKKFFRLTQRFQGGSDGKPRARDERTPTTGKTEKSSSRESSRSAQAARAAMASASKKSASKGPPLQILRLKMTCALKMIFSPAAMTSRQYR